MTNCIYFIKKGIYHKNILGFVCYPMLLKRFRVGRGCPILSSDFLLEFQTSVEPVQTVNWRESEKPIVVNISELNAGTL
jgi:hypothetical protein